MLDFSSVLKHRPLTISICAYHKKKQANRQSGEIATSLLSTFHNNNRAEENEIYSNSMHTYRNMEHRTKPTLEIKRNEKKEKSREILFIYRL